MNEQNLDLASDNSKEIDLSSLASFDFAPDWATGNSTKISNDRKPRGEKRQNNPESPKEKRLPANSKPRDRRPLRPQTKQKDSSTPAFPQENPKKRSGNNKRHTHKSSAKPRPVRVAEVAIYPEEKPFTVLAKAIKNSARTYVLFEIANIILEKPERFVVVLSPKQEKDSEGKPIETPKANSCNFYISVPDNLPFLDEESALNHIFKTHLDKFFTIEEIETEGPKGNFTMIAKCGFTGELLAPQNYHAYQQILREHHANNFPKMPFEKFMSRIETVKDPDAISAWIEKMKKVTRYTLKEKNDNEPEFLDGISAAKTFLLEKRKEKLIKTVKQARLAGTLIEKMPASPLKATIESEIAFQKKFPLNTVNGFRGNLRRLGFSLYKKGQKKGITYVCGIKRKFRTPGAVFSETIQKVFDFLEQNPGTEISALPKRILGIPDVPVESSEAPAASQPAPAAEAETSQNLETPESVPAENTAEPSSNNENALANTADQEAQIKDLIGTVRWLVTEGYVSEMSDGKLFTYPVLTEAQVKAAAKEEQPIERPEIPQVESDTDIEQVVPEAPAPVIKVIGKLAPQDEEGSTPPSE